ncbi:MAG: FixH family protein [Deltaproteobacteria bacterium]|nr:FixH family protein [Deltaproteobacteria bacterium]
MDRRVDRVVETHTTKKRGWYWPLLVIGLLGGLLVMNGIMLFVATRDPSFAVEKNYYQKALDWDEKRAQDGANDALGWSIAVSLATAGTDVRVAATITDREGAPVNGATVSLEAFHLARSAAAREIALAEETPGRYSTTWPAMRPGIWEMRFRIEKDGHVFTKSTREDWAPR